MNGSILQINGLSKSFGKSQILNDINFTIGKGEVYGLIGQNGAGKTTLIRLISGLMKPTLGSYTISTDRPYIGYMPQSCRFDDHSSVANTIRFFAALKKTDAKDSFRLCKKLELDLLKKVKHLSPGQQKKLQIVIAMAGNPDFYILDEPTAGLDPKATFEMMEIIKFLHSEGKSILISSHILGDLDEICTHIAIIEKGRIIYSRKLEDNFIIKCSSVPYEMVKCLQEKYPLQANEDCTTLTVNADNSTVSEIVKELSTHSVGIFEITAFNVKNVVEQQILTGGKEVVQ